MFFLEPKKDSPIMWEINRPVELVFSLSHKSGYESSMGVRDIIGANGANMRLVAYLL